MSSILRKAKNYKIVPKVILGEPAHVHDPYTPPPQILVPPKPRDEKRPDDISDFPRQQTVPMPEAVPYREGKYRSPSISINGGYFPYNLYLEKGKVYWYCACGISNNSPWCDSTCNKLATRNRPIYFNVNESGYYKICTCRQSADAPFCNGTHKEVAKFYVKSHRGAYEVAAQVIFWGGWVYMFWNYYT
jgi:CDGSH-type Zn-finger protein